MEDAGNRLDQGRLARAVVAGKRHDFAGMNVERNLGQRLHAAEMLGDVADGEDVVGYSISRPPMKRRWLWSTSTEMMMTQPTAMYCQNGSTLMNTSP